MRFRDLTSCGCTQNVTHNLAPIVRFNTPKNALSHANNLFVTQPSRKTTYTVFTNAGNQSLSLQRRQDLLAAREDKNMFTAYRDRDSVSVSVSVRSWRGGAGFTLIELLVVIAIISILAAILFPVFSQARAKARQVTCLSNMKQLSLALAIYRSDFDETNPGSARSGTTCEGGVYGPGWPPWMAGIGGNMLSPVPSPNTPVDPGANWVPCYPINYNAGNPGAPVMSQDWLNTGPARGVLFPYVKSKQVYLCPSDPEPVKLLSYSMNAVAGFIPDAAVDRTSNFIVLVDEQYTLNDGYFGAPNDCPAIVHNNGVNISFFDGHAKWFHSDLSQFYYCHNAIPLTDYCPSLPFVYIGNSTMCATNQD